MTPEQLFNLVLELIKAAGAIIPAVLNFFKGRKSNKDKKSSHDE